MTESHRAPVAPPRAGHGALAVVLAAGRSARMGVPKALLDWDGQPLILRHLALYAPFARVRVVLGHDPGPVLDVLPAGVAVIDPSWAVTDMTARVRFALGGHRGPAWVLPVDTAPEQAVVDALIRAGRGVPLDREGLRGHPVALGPDDVGRLATDLRVTLRDVAAALPGVPTASVACALDFDDPASFAHVRALVG